MPLATLTSETLTNSEIQQLRPTLNVLIVTANVHEKAAVFDQTKPLIGHDAIHTVYGDNVFTLGRMGVCNIVHVHCPMGEDSYASISEAISQWEPKAIIMIGVMCGLKAGIKRGDVIVSSRIHPYLSNQKRENGEKIRRYGIESCGPKLSKRFESIDHNQWKCELGDGLYSRFHVGEILSGPVLVNDPVYLNELKSEFKEAIGLEMEGAGLRLAARNGGVPEWILVKGVSDYGDGTKGHDSLPDEQIQPLAAKAATSLCLEVLKNKSALQSLGVFVVPEMDVPSSHDPRQFGLPVNLARETVRIRREEYFERWVPSLQKGTLRALILYGPSGSGKTWLATDLIEELKKQSQGTLVRFGCFEHKDRTPDAAQLLQLLQIMAPEHREDIAKTNWSDIDRKKIEQWFPPSHVPGTPVCNAFLFFDDLDGTIQPSDTGDTLDRPLLRLFRAILLADSSLSLLITCKDARMETIIEEFVGTENIRTQVESDHVGLFTDEENREYIRHFDEALGSLGGNYKDKLLNEYRLAPLFLQLICRSAHTNPQITKACLDDIKVNAVGDQEYGATNEGYQKMLHSLVRSRFEEIGASQRLALKGKNYHPELHYRVATAIAVCRAIDDIWLQAITTSQEAVSSHASLLHSILGDDARALPEVIENLRSLGILATVEEHTPSRASLEQSPEEEVRFKHGIFLEYAYNGLIESYKVKPEVRDEFHRKAAQFYHKSYKRDEVLREGKYAIERDEVLREGEYAIWHWLNGGEVESAWGFLSEIYRFMHAGFHYAQLAELREAFGGKKPLLSGALAQKAGREQNAALGKDVLTPHLSAANLADLAEVYYQGLDRWEDANKQAKVVVDEFEKGRHINENAWAQAMTVRSMYQFENSTDGELPCRTIDAVLKKANLIDPVVLATIRSNAGVYQNRLENYNKARTYYQEAEATLAEVRTKINRIKDCIRLADVEESRKLPYLSRVSIWEQLLKVDQLRLLSNLSRTILLHEDSEKAIMRLAILIEMPDYRPTKSKKGKLGRKNTPPDNDNYLIQSQENDYAKLNLSYYYLCDGDEEEAESWMSRCSASEEAWFKTTRRKMEGVIHLYNNNFDEAIRIFEEVCPVFMLMPDVRGQLFACFNATSAQILELLEALRKHSEPTPEQFHLWRRQATLISLQLGEQRIVADVKEYGSAGKVITYTSQKFARILHGQYNIESVHPLEPRSKWQANWRDEVEACLGGLMGEAFDDDGAQWRPPALMPGILLMRSLPFSPTMQEIEALGEEIREKLVA